MIDGVPIDPALIRTACFIGTFAIMAAWETLAPLRERALSRRLRWTNNLGLVLIDNLVLRLVLPVTAVGFASLAQQRHWGLLNRSDLPGWLAIPAALILLDLAIYLQHRLFHAVPVLWRLHRVHHTDTDFDVTTALRFHPVEILLSMAYKLVLIAILGASPPAVLAFEIVLNSAAMFNHSNITLPPSVERVLRMILVTPDMHRIHHSTSMHEANSNYGFNLAIWDRLFATYTQEPAIGQIMMPIGQDQFRESRDARLHRLLLQPMRNSGLAQRVSTL